MGDSFKGPVCNIYRIDWHETEHDKHMYVFSLRRSLKMTDVMFDVFAR